MNTAAEAFGNIFSTSVDTIRKNKEFRIVADGCKSNKPAEHCKTCSYKELAPMLQRLGLT
jgi:hypothetical protein